MCQCTLNLISGIIITIVFRLNISYCGMSMEYLLVYSNGSILGSQFRYDNDTIFIKYRDIDTISIYRSRYEIKD